MRGGGGGGGAGWRRWRASRRGVGRPPAEGGPTGARAAPRVSRTPTTITTTTHLPPLQFTGNAARSFGGGVYDSHVAGDVAGCKFAKNKAARGGGVFRTESKGDVGDNKGLDNDAALAIDNPVAA